MRIQKLESPKQSQQAKRVAAYARVSTGHDAQLQSLAAQTEYYSGLISSHQDWLLVGIYADEAFTGTKAARPGFQNLLAACKNGEIDLILTKSISRFSRNTVTLLDEVRKLKALNVDVYFERENIHTLSGDGELVLSILASFAQEESRTVSENIKWRIRKKFENGELVSFNKMFGYNIAKGVVTVNEAQAAVVRRIFADYIGGAGFKAIANALNAEGLTATNGGQWNQASIRGLIANEKVTGCCLTQKTYINNHIDKKQLKNDGSLPQFLILDTHPAIISQEIFEQARQIREQRRDNVKEHGTREILPFTEKIVCPHCGRSYIRKKNGGKTADVWKCAGARHNRELCSESVIIPENILESLAAEVGGAEGVTAIEPKERGILVFKLADGDVVTKYWSLDERHEKRVKTIANQTGKGYN